MSITAARTVLFFSFVACATAPKNYKASTIPKAEGISVTVTAETETDALEGAKREAKEHCEKNKRDYIVVSGPESGYQGPDRAGATGVASQVASGLFGGNRDKSADYRAQMVFNCK